ncbi:MAG TPA: hypothetical protein VGG10_22300 [Rhizomicrobium sp.]|jgi:hypothetical protein
MIAVQNATTLSDPAVSAGSVATAPTAASQDGRPDFTFHDLLSIVNPLQHLPVIGTLYRKLTGDKIGIPEKIMGDTLYGGVSGFVSSVADAVFEKVTGKNFGDTVLALVTGGDKQEPQLAAETVDAPQLALNTAAPTLQASAPIEMAQAASPKDEVSITAALNRAQITRAMAARNAYSSALALVRPTSKPADTLALAF